MTIDLHKFGTVIRLEVGLCSYAREKISGRIEEIYNITYPDNINF